MNLFPADFDNEPVKKKPFPFKRIAISIVLWGIAAAYFFWKEDLFNDAGPYAYVDDGLLIFIAANYSFRILHWIKEGFFWALSYIGRILFSIGTSIFCTIYGISPVDIIPDVVPVLGLGDDAVVILTGIYMIFRALKIIRIAKIIGIIVLIGIGIIIIYGILRLAGVM